MLVVDSSKGEEKEGSGGKLSHCHAAKPIGGRCCWAIGVKMKQTPSQRNPAPSFSSLPETSLERKKMYDPLNYSTLTSPQAGTANTRVIITLIRGSGTAQLRREGVKPRQHSHWEAET